MIKDHEAWWILEAITNKSKIEIITSNYQITPQEKEKLNIALRERFVDKKPLQYIIGNTPFCELTIQTKPPILIPRKETEEWVSWVINLFNKNSVTKFSMLDLCTGSGCISLALAKNFQEATILGIDINPEAIELANLNKKINNIKNVTFLKSNLFTKIPKDLKFDFIISNPPYLTNKEYKNIDNEVKNWEDEKALIAGRDGLFFYEKILGQAKQWLNYSESNKIPKIIMEIGKAQESTIEKLIQKHNFTQYAIHNDLQDKPRWITVHI